MKRTTSTAGQWLLSVTFEDGEARYYAPDFLNLSVYTSRRDAAARYAAESEACMLGEELTADPLNRIVTFDVEPMEAPAPRAARRKKV